MTSTSTTRRDPAEWKERFCSVLDSVERVGSVATSQVLPSLRPPKLLVNGLEEHVAFPLLSSQAVLLRGLAQASPFGKGSKTLIDESVHKSWELDASQLTVGGSQWLSTLRILVQDCCQKLGIDTAKVQVQAHLYKLLLYEQGGFFKPHQDSEKEPGMFGTLVLQLPSRFEGGALIVRHAGQKFVYDCSGEKGENNCYCTAFYGDVEHEIVPVHEGWRLCLVYNLVATTTPQIPGTPLPSAKTALGNIPELRRLAASWRDCCTSKMQGYLLEHEYTETNFGSVDQLKGRDGQIVNFLCNAKDAQGKALFTVYLLLLEKHESGQPRSLT